MREGLLVAEEGGKQKVVRQFFSAQEKKLEAPAATHREGSTGRIHRYVPSSPKVGQSR